MNRTFAIACMAILPLSAWAQIPTLSLNDATVVQSDTHRAGINIGAIDYWDNGQILKNLIGSSNPGFEPLQAQQIWVLSAAGTTTTFTIPNQWDPVQADYWAGGTVTIVESTGPELGCTGSIVSNTGPNSGANPPDTVGPTLTISPACNAPFSVYDTVIVSKSWPSTPESWWESGGYGGISGSVSGGAQLLSDTTDLCANCGAQALNMNATASGSSATAAWNFDTDYDYIYKLFPNIFVLMNGTYQLSFWAKSASGSPALTATALRLSSGGFNCGSYTPTLTSKWAQYTWNCTASESAAATSPGIAQVSIGVTGGSVYLDNVSFEKIETNPINPATGAGFTNNTVLRDEVIETLQKFYGPSIGSNPGMFRYWVNQNAETVSNWTQPDYAHAPTGAGMGYYIGPGGAGAESLSLEDYLVICQLLNAEPYLEVPVTFSTADAANLIEFLASPLSTSYGARRAALGQGAPWTGVFSQIHLAFCNECWNGGSFAGQSLPWRAGVTDGEYYFDYSVRARDIFAAMRADSYYSASSFDLVMNAQTAISPINMHPAIARAHPDSIEIEDYTYGDVGSFTSDSNLWLPAMVDPWEKVTNPNDIVDFYQSVNDYQSQTNCGASGSATCKVNIYEWGQGTLGSIDVSGVTPAADVIDQTHLDYINAGAGEGVVMALQPLLNMQYYGIGPQSFFALAEFDNGGLNNGLSGSGEPTSLWAKLWGNTVDMGGATNNVRPTFLGVQLVNQSIIGPMYSCAIGNFPDTVNPTYPNYNFAGSINGVYSNSPSSSQTTPLQLPAMNAVPYIYTFCFENGASRSLVLINTDLSNSRTIGFAGTNPPQGTVTQRQYAPGALDDMNEAPTGYPTYQTPATVAINTSTLSSSGSITLPPFSVTALDYSVSGLPIAASPTFSPAAGTYTTQQSVTIGDATAGTTIYYTTNGTTPTTSSTKYGGPITVSATETLQAIAVETGYTNSAVASATYTIAVAPTLPAPTFLPAPGTYTSPQSVTIGDATAGASIYYTINGTTPTTSSTKYGSPITVSATETLQAIAVETGYTNSAVASVTYTIVVAPALPAPTFSPAPGTYTSPQSITIGDATAGTTIYYTTNGTAPTTSSSVYNGPITVSATKTLQAIAVETGYTNSAVASATYTIAVAPTLPAPTFSPTPGTYTSPQSVTIGDATAGTTIYYTTNGATPTTSSTKYGGPITVSATETLQAIAVETGYTNSAVASATYTINPLLPAPTFSPAPGTYTSPQSVTIGDATAGTTIYYTTNGATPTTSSTKYGGPITVSATETLQAIAVETGYTNSAVASATYTISSSSGSSTVLPAPTFSPAAGSYAASPSVTISDATAGTTIYYTADGTTPTTASSIYGSPITVSATETLQAIAVESGYTDSAVASATYTITSSPFSIAVSPASLSMVAGQPALATVAINPVNGFNQTVSFGCAGLPAGLSCSFSPSSITTGGTPATTTLILDASPSMALRRGPTPFIPVVAAFLLCAIGFRRRRGIHLAILIAGLVLGQLALNGCGGSQGKIVPLVSSTVTVTATAGTMQQSAILSVTVN